MSSFFGARDPAAPLVWKDNGPISAARFLADATALADSLPPTGNPINLSNGRYELAVGLMAALIGGRTSLMPPNTLPETLARLGREGQGSYALVDDAATDTAGLPALDVRTFVGTSEPPITVPEIDPAFEAVRLFTSGSSGAPQPHGKSWGQLRLNIEAAAARIASLIGRPSLDGVTLVATVPAQHSYGLESSVLLSLLGGAIFDAGRPFFPADVADALKRVPRPRALVTTPYHLKTLLLAGITLPHVDLVLSATAPLTQELARQAETVFGSPLVEIYGCTEAGQVATRRPTLDETWRTFDTLQLRRRDDTCFVSGGHVLEETPLTDAIDIIDPRHFRLNSRSNDLIQVAGRRCSLSHLNTVLERVDGVVDGAFWMPPETDGSRIVRPIAFAVAPSLRPEDIVTALRAEIEAPFVPRRVVFVDALPREATGKLGAAALERFAQEKLAAVDGFTFDVPSDHPAFQGHFPDRPILPGVVLLSMVLRSIERCPPLLDRFGPAPRIDKVKFLKPVPPGSRIAVFLEAGENHVAFRIGCDGEPTAQGRLSR